MKFQQKSKTSIWRIIVPVGAVVLLCLAGYALWSPGLNVRDGRHDRGKNAIWIAHGWLGDDAWFFRNGRTNLINQYRDRDIIRNRAKMFRELYITDIFPHLCPASSDGPIPNVDAAQAERFLDEFAGFRVMPWIGGGNGGAVRAQDEKWRQAFIASVKQLFEAHPRFAGVQLNVEPLPNGDADFLKLLEELKAALPSGKILSVAAYPPPMRWQPSEEVHWGEDYFRQVAKRCDQMAVMMYDTGIGIPKLYQKVMADWTTEILAWSENKPVLFGVPTYDDPGVAYHNSKVENLKNALYGIHRGLTRQPLPENYQGVAVYCDWETDEAEWKFFLGHFSKP